MVLVRGRLSSNRSTAPRTLAALEEWLAVRAGAANKPIFIALDGKSYGKRLSRRSVARVEMILPKLFDRNLFPMPIESLPLAGFLGIVPSPFALLHLIGHQPKGKTDSGYSLQSNYLSDTIDSHL